MAANLTNATTKCTKHLMAAMNGSNAGSAGGHDHHSMMGSSHGQHNLHDGMIVNTICDILSYFMSYFMAWTNGDFFIFLTKKKMSFHGGYNEVILFDFWKTESVLSK